ncbi:MAG: nuclear transport factor 2 family protein [Deltaproteobacteria bacterium]|nr:nuclear transport factor 2 family protein [Deltaproteobacteria bacterium]
MAAEHPARAAARRSMDAVHAKDRAAWLDNFADEAIIEDPIGVSPLCPDGKGHRGKEAIARFWDSIIAPNRVLFEMRESHACGDECANVGTITTVLADGSVSRVAGVFTYRVDAAGKVQALRAYWEFERMAFFPRA